MKIKDEQEALDVLLQFDTIEEKQKVLTILRTLHKKVPAYYRGKEYLLAQDTICYIESVDKKTLLHTRDGYCYEAMLWLYQLEEQLNDDFIRISKAVIVNVMHIESMQAELGSRILLYLDDKKELLVTRTYARALKQKLKGESK